MLFFFYVKKWQTYVKKNAFPCVKRRTSAWKNHKKCPWKTNFVRENFFKITYVKNQKMYVKKQQFSIREKYRKLENCAWKKPTMKLLRFPNKKYYRLLVMNSWQWAHQLCASLTYSVIYAKFLCNCMDSYPFSTLRAPRTRVTKSKWPKRSLTLP